MDEERFGYLGTDEERTTAPRKSDYERSVLGGCITFSIAATLQLAAIAIPLLLERSLHTYAELHAALLVFMIAGGVVGVAFSAFTGVAGLFGSLSGLVPAATFLWLRLSDKVSGHVGIEGMEPAEYPESYAYLAPALICTALAALFLGAFWLRSLLNRESG